MRCLFTFLLLVMSLRAGVTAHFTQGEREDERHDALPALYVAEGEAASAWLKPGPFEVVWTGKLVLDKRSRVYFSFEGRGEAVLLIKGEEVLRESKNLGGTESKRLRLNAGEHPVEIRYMSPPTGVSQFRLLWRGRDFVKEALPAWYFKNEQQEDSRAGFHLIKEQNCVNCHASDKFKGEPGPDLTGIGSRVTREWLTRWISDPAKLKPNTTMPAMVDHATAEGAQSAADIAAYLAELKEGPPMEATKSHVDFGKTTFHELGCVGCHTLPSVSKVDYEHSRIPLNNVAAKFQKGALRAFLKKPNVHWEAIKMPDFQLSDEEATALSSYLREASTGKHTPDPSEFPPGDVARGAMLVKNLNCAACHEGLPQQDLKMKSFKDILGSRGGCLTEKPKAAPRFNLTKNQKTQIHGQMIPGVEQAMATMVPVEFAQHELVVRRCATCHEDDYDSALLSSVYVESKRILPKSNTVDEHLDQSRPSLKHMGEMLNTEAIESMLRGGERYRPWLKMRMPAFGYHSEILAKGMSARHGLPPNTKSVEIDEEKVKAGKKLISAQGGFACVTCHGVGETKALAAFEVQGINFADCAERLRKGYFMKWMDNPHRVEPTTKMPRYSLGKGKSLLATELNGDFEAQSEAIWHFLQSIK